VRCRAARTLIVLAAVLGILSAASTCLSAEAGKKVLVIGFDGMDPRLTSRLMEEGRLPNFVRLAERGGFSRLTTSVPPQSPVAWSNFITGQNPGGHGIFDFIARTPETYLPYLSTSITDEKGTHNVRQGISFWEVLEQHGVPCTIIRVPSNYPPVPMKGHSISGMGTPDVLGTYGTFSFFTTEPQVPGEIQGGKVYEVSMKNGRIETSLEGPRYKDDARFLAPFTVWVDPEEPVAKFRLGDEEWILKEGEWSDWKTVKLEVEMPWTTRLAVELSGEQYPLRGIARFYLKEVRPEFRLYVSPVNFDPLNPPTSTALSTPDDYAKTMAKAIGRFYTQGMAEDTWALNEGRLDDDEFLEQSKFVADDWLRMFDYELDRFDDGLLFMYFSSTDLLQHMFMRFMDDQHPMCDPDGKAKYGHVIPDTYCRMDSILGMAMDRVGEGTDVIVLSDHGFTSYRRHFHLNTWLYENGYIALRDERKKSSGEFFVNVDWRRTRAYALGLNCLYLNLKGREGQGTVSPGFQSEELLSELVTKLEGIVDPETGERVIYRAYRTAREYSGPQKGIAPDLVIGYNDGYRASWETALGKIPDPAEGLIHENLKKWSGDHCMATELIPGILLASKAIRIADPALTDLAPTILNEFGVAAPPEMIGRNLFGETPRVAAR
jgi:predicted AlkP superfamily phosphohydrolase/phosphomutase